jgi:hypothetical protein
MPPMGPMLSRTRGADEIARGRPVTAPRYARTAGAGGFVLDARGGSREMGRGDVSLVRT